MTDTKENQTGQNQNELSDDQLRRINVIIAEAYEDDEPTRSAINSELGNSDVSGFPNELLAPEFDKVDDSENYYQMIKGLGIPAKIKLALFGNKTARMCLIRDKASKQIPLFVLENQRITENELLEIARNPNLDERVLRKIGNDPNWMKNYQMKLAIVTNARVPIGVALKWIKHLQERDLRRIARSKSIPNVVVTQARKIIEKKARPSGG